MSETIMDLGYKIHCGEATPQDAIEWMKLTSNGNEIRDKAIAILEKATTRTRTPAPAEVEGLVEDLIHYSAVITTYILGMTDESKTLEDATESFKQAKSRLLAALSNTTPYLSQDVNVEELEAGKYRMMIPIEITIKNGILLDRKDGIHAYRPEDYPNARFFKGW